MHTDKIDWQTAPPPEQRSASYDLIRCPPGSTGPWLITSKIHIGCQLFWMNGRSNPHLGTDCPGCAADKPHRWTGWLCVYDERRLRHCILEITPNCLGPINEHLLQCGSLRGARIRLFRANGKPNGRITAEIMRSELTLTQIPEPFDLPAEMQKLWQAPNKNNKPQLETPRVHAEAQGRTLLGTAKVSKVYEATDEQKAMLEAHKKKNATATANPAPPKMKPFTAADMIAAGIRPQLAEAIASPDKKKQPTKTNGYKK